MSVNKYEPHVFVLPEDDANRQIANGFQKNLPNQRSIQILRVARGWKNVVEYFVKDQAPPMIRYPDRYFVLLVDFDRRIDRGEEIRNIIQSNCKDVADRVFVLGAFSEPENLRTDLGSFEEIGEKLAEDCEAGTRWVWNHKLLQHNATELARMTPIVKPILFS